VSVGVIKSDTRAVRAFQIDHSCKSVVDVRDVAAAHIAAFERGTVWGRRVLLVAGNPHWAEIAGYVRHSLPDDLKENVPMIVSSTIGAAVLGAPAPLPTMCDATPAETELGIKYTSVAEMVCSSVRSALDNGFKTTAQYVPGK
jgi:nucleoside-diphosphate-sugar epimerase